MTDDQMKAASAAWFSTHPRTGGGTVLPANATVKVGNFYFDADNNLSTTLDTVRINASESVTWTWVIGLHTITSGTGSGDPDAGQLFNQPMDSGNNSFTFFFPDPGIYPYFCSIHELSMRGVVKVTGTAGVTPIGGTAERPGFASSPSPNPTGAGTSFRFVLAAAGRTLVEVFDVAGRRMAVVIDRQLGPGGYQASWDGRSSDGKRVRPGAYFVRLAAPGIDESRRLIVVH